jgi:hypothetical protein
MSSDLLFGYIALLSILALLAVMYVIPSIIGLYSIAKTPNKCSQFNYAGFLARTVAFLLDDFFILLLCSIASLISSVIACFIYGLNGVSVNVDFPINLNNSQLVILVIFMFFIEMVAIWLYFTLM